MIFTAQTDARFINADGTPSTDYVSDCGRVTIWRNGFGEWVRTFGDMETVWGSPEAAMAATVEVSSLTEDDKATVRASLAYAGATARFNRGAVKITLDGAQFASCEETIAHKVEMALGGRRVALAFAPYELRTTTWVNTHPSAFDLTEAEYIAQRREVAVS